MNWQPSAGKVAVVKRYLAGAFPGAEILDATDFDTTSQFFNARERGGQQFRLAVPRVVFDDFTDGQIAQLLQTSDAADRMRAAAPERVTLTPPS